MKAVDSPVDYELRLVATAAATGYFGVVARPEPGDAASLEYVRSRPNDEFMRRHLLRLVQGWEDLRLKEAIAAAEKEDPFLLAVFWEASPCTGSRRKSGRLPASGRYWFRPNACFYSATWTRSNFSRPWGRAGSAQGFRRKAPG